MTTPPDPEHIHLLQEAILGRLVPDLIHQLRNPLNSILTSAELLEERGGNLELQEKLLPVILRSAGRIKELLSFVDHRPDPGEGAPFELRQGMQDALGLLHSRGHTMAIEPAMAGAPIELAGKPEHIWTLVLALLDESLSFASTCLSIRISETANEANAIYARDGMALSKDAKNSESGRESIRALAGSLGATVYYEEVESSERQTVLSLPKLYPQSEQVEK
ncbi:MAG: hypothetical protein GY811_08550 [Myxococcales bacterium]|nr:hypothetical protein [Myxococcales bacterium]